MHSMNELLELARSVATTAHRGQFYGKEPNHQPYTVHLEAVASLARLFGGSDEVIAAAWLHDIIEDTDMTQQELREIFPDRVVDLVLLVTDEPGTRREKLPPTLTKIRTDSEAVFLKLCDNTCNCMCGVFEGSSLLNMYRKEDPLFREYLYREGEHEGLWALRAQLLARPQLSHDAPQLNRPRRSRRSQQTTEL